MEGANHPSQALIDRHLTILVKGAVRYAAWEKCTSQQQELQDEEVIKGLRIDPASGALMQDVAPDKTTDLSSELLWDFALRRRASAADISGLIRFEPMNDWHEDLKSHLLETPPSRFPQGLLEPAAQRRQSPLALRAGALCGGHTGKARRNAEGV